MKSPQLWYLVAAGFGLAALVMVLLGAFSQPARAAGWDATSMSVGLDTSYYSSGDTMTITVSGSDYDSNESNNLQTFDARVTTYSGTVITAWNGQAIGTLSEVVIHYTIPHNVASGTYYVRVYRPGDQSYIDSSTFYLTRVASVSLELDDYSYYQGDMMRINVHIANDSITQLSLAINSSTGSKTTITGALSVSMGDNYHNWTVPRSLKAGTYEVEAYLPGGTEPEASVTAYIQRPYTYHTAYISPGKYSSSYYAPGETVNIRLVGDELANYTVNVSMGTTVMKSWTKVQLDAGGQANLSLPIPLTAGDGTYNLTMIAEDGTEFVVDTLTVKMYLIDLYPERAGFLPGETLNVYYTVRNLMDGALAAPASGSWQLYEGNRNVRDSGTFATPSGSFQVHLPAATNYPDYVLRVWYNDTAASRSTSASADIPTGPLQFSLDVEESYYHPGSVAVFSMETTVGAGNYDPPAPGVPITMFKVFTRRSGGEWAQNSAYAANPGSTDAMGRAQVVLVIQPTTEDMTEFRVDATAAKGSESRNDSAYFTVRKSSDISATIRLDRTAYTAGQTMHINVATYTTNVTGQLTFTYRIMSGSYYSASGRVFLVKTSPNAYLDWTTPDDLESTVYISVMISGPNGASGATSTEVGVFFGTITVNASPATFRANTTVRITYSYSSGDPETPQLFCQITDADGNLVKEMQLSGGRSGGFNFKVPAAASGEYDVKVFAYRNGKILASQTFTINHEPLYTLTLSVDRDTVAPGEKVRITYKVVRHANAPAIGEPATIKYGDLAFQNEFQTSKMEGSFEYKVPDGATEGPLIIYVTWSPEGSSTGAYSSATVLATKAPGGLAMGRTDTLLLVLAIFSLVVAILAVLMARGLSKRLRAQGLPLQQQYAAPAASPAPAQQDFALPQTPAIQQHAPQPYYPAQQAPPQSYSPPPQPVYQPPPQPAPVQSDPQPVPPVQTAPGPFPQPQPQPMPQPMPQPQPQPHVQPPAQPQPVPQPQPQPQSHPPEEQYKP